MIVHEVQQGEHMGSIAARHGFSRHDAVWGHPDNAELAKRRKPEILLPGDVVKVPAIELKSVDAPSGKAHRFRVQQDQLELRLRLRGLDGAPRENLACVVDVEGRSAPASTDGQGTLVTRIAASVRSVTISVDDASFDVAVGSLDPPGETTGWQARLVNLGYLEEILPPPPPEEDVADDDARELRGAIEEFQCDHALSQTGELDDATRAKLVQEHGC